MIEKLVFKKQIERSDDRCWQVQIFFKGFCCFSSVCFNNMNFFGSEELLSNTGGLWSVILPLFAHKWHCRGKAEVSKSYLAMIHVQKADWVTPICRYQPWYPSKEMMKERRLVKITILGLANASTLILCQKIWNLPCDQCCCFCLCSLTWAHVHSTLEGWKISPCLHLVCSPVVHTQLE